jgi:hypothetical protein
MNPIPSSLFTPLPRFERLHGYSLGFYRFFSGYTRSVRNRSDQLQTVEPSGCQPCNRSNGYVIDGLNREKACNYRECNRVTVQIVPRGNREKNILGWAS